MRIVARGLVPVVTIHCGGGGSGTDGGSGPGAQVFREKLTFNSGVVQQARFEEVADGGCAFKRQNMTVTFSGTNVTATATCPTPCPNCGGTIGYTATSTTFSIHEPRNGGAMRVNAFTKQEAAHRRSAV